MGNKVKYRDLSIPLKLAIVFAYIVGAVYALFFLIGLIEGFIGV
jgi:hypothetical protein